MNTLPYPSQALASQGRYGDSTLVHMNPQEVSGLQALARSHGTSLTVNPQTGLPEAFRLKSLLPMIAGLALGPAGVGLSALQAGMVTGAATGLMTKDPMQGLMAGLGGYSGAGIGAGLGAAGATAPGAIPGAAPGAIPGAAAPITGANPAFYGDLSQLTAGEMGAFTTPPPATMGQNFAQMGRGFTNVFSGGPTGETARSEFMKNAGGLPSLASLGASTLFGGEDKEGDLKRHEHYLRPYDLDITNVSGTYDPLESSRERDQLSYNFRARDPIRVAQGGAIRYQEGGLAAMMRPEEAITPPMDGRFLRGNGDGMSDEIPASIEGEQDALLSDGEFVIPADVVSHIGNGSSEAGAKILYQMMDRVRKARTGQEEQAEEIDVEEFLPA